VLADFFKAETDVEDLVSSDKLFQRKCDRPDNIILVHINQKELLATDEESTY